MTRVATFSLVFSMGLFVACADGCSDTLPPYAQALVIVDTDMDVPRFIDRLRVDSYAADGTWFESRDYALLNSGQWPTSFSAFSVDTTRETAIILRLRGYTTGRTRAYHGERFIETTGDIPRPPTRDAELPRMIANGDSTPVTEPQPETTIDRLIEVVVHPGKEASLTVVLRGDCMGTMARLSAAGSFHGLVPGEAQTCIDKAHVRTPLAISPLESKPKTLPASVQGTWSTVQSCAPDASTPTVRCVDGGTFFFGSPYSAPWDIGSMPQHVAAVSRFKLGRNEVTVGQWRAALAAGLKSPDETPWPLERALPTPDSNDQYASCTWSVSAQNREDYPLNCITWAAARAYCQKDGGRIGVAGDLPTEAQWEYAATTAGRRFETHFPWGDDFPECKRAIVERDNGRCSAFGFGPQPITAAPDDRTVQDILNLGGSMSEWVLDTVARLDDPCWESASPRDPMCSVADQPHVERGADWAGNASFATTRTATRVGFYHTTVGFRCAYPAP